MNFRPTGPSGEVVASISGLETAIATSTSESGTGKTVQEIY
jgi:hypothetical protein